MNDEQRSAKITRDTLPQAVKSALHECQSQMEQARQEPTNYGLIRDLTVAVDALQGIDAEISGERPQRPQGQRSASFIRSAIDEGERMVMDPGLRDRIVKIEDIYKRC
jgi:hypothetical protein